jgi:hypothetical protein
MARLKFVPDNFTLSLIGTVIVASLFPVHGQAAIGFNWLTNFAVGLLSQRLRAASPLNPRLHQYRSNLRKASRERHRVIGNQVPPSAGRPV